MSLQRCFIHVFSPHTELVSACTRCKKRKVKCNRKSPCTQCAKSKAPCVYPSNPPVPAKSKTASKEPKNDRNDVEALVGERAGHHILQAIPEANLLHPGIMLTLSRELFMNRSADSPSPWLHWSHYVSELTTEPSMYRTAFNDFHRLVISLTRRLVQTTIVQATSRLRAQRLRKDKKGLLPFVKLKDVYTAIDVLGMKRNGIERWRGVPRRCGLKVVTSKKTPRGKRTREVPWSEVECILGSATPLNEQAASGEESDNFKSRAMRSGTPLPMHSLALSDSDVDVELVGTTGDSDGSDFSEQSVADERQSSIRHVFQPRDHIGRYASAPADRTNVEASTRLDTVEQFDQEASHLGESMLWDILGIQPAANNDLKLGEGSQEIDRDINEKVTTESKNWRQSLDYRAAWEKYRTQVSVSKFAGNQKPLGRMPLSFDTRTSSVTPSSGNLSDTSNNTKAGRDNRKTTTEVELLVRGTNAYAALQREDLESSSQGSESTYSSNESMLLEQDIPTESIETQIEYR
jgi:RNA polymerase I-specific transcription initiation factor RRN5